MKDEKQIKCAHADCQNTFVPRVGFYWFAMGQMYCSPQCQRRALDAWFASEAKRKDAATKQAGMFDGGA